MYRNVTTSAISTLKSTTYFTRCFHKKSHDPHRSNRLLLNSILLLLLFCAVPWIAKAQVTVAATAGTANASYATVNDAFGAINAGTHQGAIDIAISANTTEPTPPTILAASGVGSASYSSIAIYPSVAGVVVSGTSNASTGILVFNGADDITINGNLNNGAGTSRDMTIENTTAVTNAHSVIWFQGSTASPQLGATNIVIKNVVIIGNGNASGAGATTTYSSGILFAGTASPASTSLGANHANILIQNNHIQRTNTGIHVGNATGTPVMGLIIEDNTIGSSDPLNYVYYRGMWLSNTSGSIIRKNHIFNIKPALVTQTLDRMGMEIAGTGSASVTIDRNLIHSLGTFSTSGYAGYGINLNGGNNHLVLNNLVYDISGYGWTSMVNNPIGIRLSAGNGHKVYYNSVNMNGSITRPTGGYTAAIAVASTVNTGIDIRNNILNNKMTNDPGNTTVENMSIWFVASYNFGAVGNDFNNNGYFFNPTSPTHYLGKVGITVGTSLYSDLFSWQQVTGQDGLSVPLIANEAPFTSDSNLTIPTGTQTSIESGGVVITSLGLPNTDYNGTARPAGTGTAPDIGAYEFEGIAPSGCSSAPTAGTASISQTSICNGQSVELSVTGYTIDFGIEIQWKESSVTGGPYTAIPGATDPVYNTDPLASNTYFVAVVTCANTSDSSTTNEVAVTVENPQILSTTPATRCGIGTVTLEATADTSYIINWYDVPSGGAPLDTGSSFTTPVLTDTTTFWVAAMQSGGVETAGKLEPSPATSLLASPRGIIFNAYQSFTIQSVTIFSTTAAAGTGTIALYDGSGNIVDGPIPVSWAGGGTTTNPIPYVLNIGFRVTPGNSYRLIMATMVGSSIAYQTTNITGTWPSYSPPGNAMEMTGSATSLTGTSTTTYYYFFDWLIETECEGTRLPVTATVTPAPAINVVASVDRTCNGASTMLSVSSSNAGYTYSWEPGAQQGDSISVSPTQTTTYTVTATDNSTGPNEGCVYIDEFTVEVLPAAVTIDANVSEHCFTGSSDLTLTPAFNVPPGTVQWQTSADGSTWSDISGADGISYTTPVLSSTTYYRALIFNALGDTCLQAIESIVVNEPQVVSVTPGFHCGPGTVELFATGSPGTDLNWYETDSGGTAVGAGSSFTTPLLNSSTDYYVEAVVGDGVSSVGAPDLSIGAFASWNSVAQWVNFTVHQATTIQSVEMYFSGTLGSPFSIVIREAGSLVTVHTHNDVVTNTSNSTTIPPTSPQIVPIDAVLPPGNYQMNFGSPTGTFRNSTGGVYPYTIPGVISITGNTFSPVYYYMFYNWQVSTDCVGPRVPVTATIHPPAPIVDLGPDIPVCENIPFTLSLDAGNVGSTYLWSTGATTQSIQVTIPGQYWVRATNPDGVCFDSDTIEIFETALLTIDLGQDIPYCAGEPISETWDVFEPGATYMWQDGSTSGVYTATTAGLYAVTVTSQFGCVSTGDIEIYINPLPVVSIEDITICSNAPTVLDAGNPGETYAWNTGATSQTITVNTSGFYSVTVTDGNSCMNSDNAVVTVLPAPVPVITSTNLCPGSYSVLDVGNIYASYTWSVGSFGHAIAVTNAGTYSVTVTSANGCSEEASTNITMSPAPTVSVANASACVGETVTLDAGNPGEMYMWSTGAITQTITTGATGTYSVTVTNAFGCTASDNATVSLDQPPVVNLSSAAICPGQSATLNAGNPGATYLWNTNATTQSITATTAGNYSVTVTNAAGCKAVGNAIVSVGTNPVVNLSNATICDGEVAVIDAGPGASFLWSTNATTQKISVSTASTVNVTVTNSAGCTGTGSATVTVNPTPTVSLANATICKGQTATLDAGNPGATYMWNTGATSQSIAVELGGSYSVTVTNSSNCRASGGAMVTVNPAPVVDFGPDPIRITNTAQEIELDAGNPGGTYQWSTGANTRTIWVSQAGTYSVTVTFPNGCTASGTAEVVLAIGMETLSGWGTAVLFPNPTSDVANVRLELKQGGTFYVEIFDLTGRNVGSQVHNLGQGTHSLPLHVRALAQGTYMVRIRTDEGLLGTMPFLKL